MGAGSHGPGGVRCRPQRNGPAGVAGWPGEPGRVQAPARRMARRWPRVARSVAAAAVGAAIAAGSCAAPAPSGGRSPPARLEQTVTDRSAELESGLTFSPDGMLLAVTSFQSTAVINLA